jgi:predicted enzyme related to lactoylglutathione lyase
MDHKRPIKMTDDLQIKLDDLKSAVDFYERVINASMDEQIAVGQDHWKWLISASKGVAGAIDNQNRSETDEPQASL